MSGKATKVPLRLALQVVASVGSIGVAIGREALWDSGRWVRDVPRRGRVLHGELAGLVDVIGDPAAR